MGRIKDKPYTLYETLVGKLLTRCQSVAPDHTLRFSHPHYSLDAPKVTEVINKPLQTKSVKAAHWPRTLMAQEVGLNAMAISRIWRTFGLKPHRLDTIKLSTDPHFVDKVHDIVGLYMSPSNKALVLCVDEKSQIQALNRAQPAITDSPAYRALCTMPKAIAPGTSNNAARGFSRAW